MRDHTHDPAPEARDVKRVGPSIDGFDDAPGHGFRVGCQGATGQVCGHRRSDDTGLYGENVHAAFGKTGPET